MDYYNNPFFQQNPLNLTPAMPQRITRVNGRESINSLRMTPNSELLALDNTAPILWVCVSDGVGAVKAEPYDITKHKEPSTGSDFEARLSALEKLVIKMGVTNESGDTAVEHSSSSADIQ